jgi:hypothetical protein
MENYYDLGIHYNSEVYQSLLEQSFLDEHQVMPDNFEQRTQLSINTYPKLMQIFTSLDYLKIRTISGNTPILQPVSLSNSNVEDQNETASKVTRDDKSPIIHEGIIETTLEEILINEFGFDSKYGYIGKHLNNISFLEIVKNNYPILNPPGSIGYSPRYTKLHLYHAMIALGFAPSNDLDPKLRKPTLADIIPNKYIKETDHLIPLPGFNTNSTHKKNFMVSGTIYRKKGEKTWYYGDEDRLTSLTIYYETVYRSLARTSQHLPWEDFILKLERYDKLLQYPKSDRTKFNIYGKSINLRIHSPKYPLSIHPETIEFIASYDYDISDEIIESSTTTELCKIIYTRILAMQKEHTSVLKQEIQAEQPQFIGGIVPKSEYLSSKQNIDEYLVHYQDVLQLCKNINDSSNENDSDHRSELFRYLKIFDLFDLFKKPLDTYNNREICSVLSKYLRSLFEERRQGGYRIDKYL